jgi:hypothetical protein
MIDFRTTNSGKLPPDRAVATAVWGEGEETLGAPAASAALISSTGSSVISHSAVGTPGAMVMSFFTVVKQSISISMVQSPSGRLGKE